ncbi:N-acetylgalactosamine-N,N'-diacetylbacillosaminyl-diphospho-undecaprenol 4-alpha-N-acetylgalactosaminyltransferase [subsurface metagenome]|nr:glycosyltransferase [Clostridia bacterium]
MSNKKILFVIYSIYGGGAEKQMQYILRYIDRKKFELNLAVFHLTGTENELVPEDVPIFDLGTKLRPASIFLTYKLISLIKKIKPDRILSFLWGTNLISILAGILTKTDFLISERTFSKIDIKGYSLPKLRKKMISLLYPKAEKITTVSYDVRENLCKYFDIPESKIEVIYNGIDLEKIKKLKNEYEINLQSYLLACGGLHKWKNYDFLIEVMAELKSLSLVILGEGPLRKHLKEKAESLGVDLILPGYINNPYPYFKKARAFVLTSLYEGFPNVVLEAMACGVPVVSVDCPGGVNEIIENGKTGLLVPSDDKKVLAGAMIKLLKDENLCKVLTENAYRKVKEEFTLARMVKSYEDVLK